MGLRLPNSIFLNALFALAAFTAAVALVRVASGGEYPLRENTEIIMISDPRVDFELRNVLTRMVRYSHDHQTFSFLNEPGLGRPMAQSINYANNRGKRGRVMFDWTASVVEGQGTKNQISVGMLMGEQCKGDAVCAHPIEKLAAGLTLSDYSHGKYHGWDVGTPYEVAHFSGRNLTDHALHTLDVGFIIRPIDPSKPYLGTDLAANFEEIYAIMREMAVKNPIAVPIKSFKTGSDKTIRVAMTEAQKAQVIEVLNLLRKPPKADDVLKDYQFRPKSVQLRTNSLMKQLRGSEYRKKEIQRYSFANDIHANVAAEIDALPGRGSVIDLTAYSYGPTSEIHQALIRYVRRGGELNVFTNGQSAHATAFRNGIAVYYSYESLLDLFEKSDGPNRGKVNVHLLDADKAKAAGKGYFIHRKMITLSGGGKKFFYTGSDNLTWSSGKKNDELHIRIEDDRMTDRMKALSRSELDVFEQVDEAEIRFRYSKRPFLYRCLKTLIRKIF